MFQIDEFMFWSLIFMRVTGFIVINPILGRSGIPGMAKGGLVFALTLLIGTAQRGSAEIFTPGTSLEYGVLLLSEFAVGIGVAFVIQMIFYVISYAGALIDFQMGMSMVNVYDPQTRAQVALTGSIYQAFFFLLFFAVDGHLMLMKVLIQSSNLVPYGHASFSAEMAQTMLDIFKECTILGIRMTLPILITELLTGMAVGILMKAIPQVNIFVINIQVKIFVGLIMLFLLCVPMGDFLQNLIPDMQNMMERVLQAM